MHSFLNPLHLFCPLPHVSDIDSPCVDIYSFAPVANFSFPITYSFWAWPKASVQ